MCIVSDCTAFKAIVTDKQRLTCTCTYLHHRYFTQSTCMRAPASKPIWRLSLTTSVDHSKKRRIFSLSVSNFLKAVLMKCKTPPARTGRRRAFIMTSSRGLPSRFEIAILTLMFGAADASCVLMNNCVNSCLRKVCVFGFNVTKSNV